MPSVELELALLSAMYASQSFLLPVQYGRDLIAWSLRVYYYCANAAQRDVCFSAPIQSRHASMRAIGLLYMYLSGSLLFAILPHRMARRARRKDRRGWNKNFADGDDGAQKAKHDAKIKST